MFALPDEWSMTANLTPSLSCRAKRPVVTEATVKSTYTFWYDIRAVAHF